MIFEPLTIGKVTFKNRLLRSSMGGRSAYYDGTVNNAWKNFELRFAQHGLGAIISATLNVNGYRWSPLEYPQISQDKFIRHLARNSGDPYPGLPVHHPDRRPRVPYPDQPVQPGPGPGLLVEGL